MGDHTFSEAPSYVEIDPQEIILYETEEKSEITLKLNLLNMMWPCSKTETLCTVPEYSAHIKETVDDELETLKY